MVFLSATPADFEFSRPTQVVEQIIRPTGLVDPEVMVRPTKGQIDDLLHEIKSGRSREQRVLVTTLTKKMAEDLTDYLLEMGVQGPLHALRDRHPGAGPDHARAEAG